MCPLDYLREKQMLLAKFSWDFESLLESVVSVYIYIYIYQFHKIINFSEIVPIHLEINNIPKHEHKMIAILPLLDNHC